MSLEAAMVIPLERTRQSTFYIGGVIISSWLGLLAFFPNVRTQSYVTVAWRPCSGVLTLLSNSISEETP